MDIRLNVQSVLTDAKTETQVVLLRAEGSKELLPIWVGGVEGNAIKLALEGILPARPMTHDLLKQLLDHLNVEPLKVVVNEIKNNTYYATIHMRVKDRIHTVDSRPSDAIAMALRTNIPIFALDSVLKEKSSENLDSWLQKLHPKDFGKYNA